MAKFTLLEAARNRLSVLVLILLLPIFGLAVFVGELAVTEARQVRVLILASTLRWFAVMTVSLFVIAGMARECNDKGMEMLLSLPLSRGHYYFGKLLGYSCLGLLIAVCVSLPLLMFAAGPAVILWFIALCCELSIIIALSLAALFTFTHITSAYAAVTAFYLLARSIDTIRLLAAGPTMEFATFPQQCMSLMINMIALLLPDLSVFTNSAWLIRQTEEGHLLPMFSQTIVYLAILIAVGLFDLYRKSL